MQFTPADKNTRTCYCSLSPYQAEDLVKAFSIEYERKGAFKWELPVAMERFCRVSQEHPCPISLLHQAHIMPVKISHLQTLISCSFFSSHTGDPQPVTHLFPSPAAIPSLCPGKVYFPSSGLQLPPPPSDTHTLLFNHSFCLPWVLFELFLQ